MGGVQNRTIDDTFGDLFTGKQPIYFPPTGVWEGVICPGCSIQPDTNMAFNGTWSAATYWHGRFGMESMSIQLEFKGTAIYVFFILSNTVPGTPTTTNCNFTLDGLHAGTYLRKADSTTNLVYNSLVYSRRGLTNTDHNLTISTSGNVFVWMNFDYAIYTVEDVTDTSPPPPNLPSPSASSINPPPATVVISQPTTSQVTQPTTSQLTTSQPTSSQPTTSQPSTSQPSTSQPPSQPPPHLSNPENGGSAHTGAIAGGLVGGLISMVALASLLFMYWRRRRRHRRGIDESLRVMPNDLLYNGTALGVDQEVRMVSGGKIAVSNHRIRRGWNKERHLGGHVHTTQEQIDDPQSQGQVQGLLDESPPGYSAT